MWNIAVQKITFSSRMLVIIEVYFSRMLLIHLGGRDSCHPLKEKLNCNRGGVAEQCICQCPLETVNMPSFVNSSVGCSTLATSIMGGGESIFCGCSSCYNLYI